MLLTVVLAIVFVLLLIILATADWKTQFPGPPFHRFFLNPITWRFMIDKTYDANLIEEMNNIHRKYNLPTFHVNVGKSIVLTTDVRLAEYVVGKRESFQALDSMRNAITARMGPSMFMSEGEKWKQKHRALQPLLSIKMLKQNVTVVNEKMKEMVSRLQQTLNGQKKELEVLSEVRSMFVDVIGQVAFGAQFSDLIYEYLKSHGHVTGELTQQEKRTELLKLASYFFDAIAYRLKTPKRMWRKGKIYDNETISVAAFSHCFDQMLKEYKDSHPDDSSDEEDGHVNLLSILASAQKKGLYPHDEMLGECFSIFMAGHDTTASTASFTIGLLAKNPAAQAKLREEVKALCREKKIEKEEDVFFTFDDLTKLKYAHAVIKESMRIYPVAPGLPREAIVDEEFEGYKIPKGTFISVNTAMIHRSEEFYANPWEFIPERWLDADHPPSKVASAFSYLPFGTGSRSCFGQRFAILGLKTFLAHLILSFQLQTVPGKPLEEENSFGLTLKGKRLDLFVQPIPNPLS